MHIDFDIKANIKKRIIENVNEAIKDWEKRPESKATYGTPVIGYVSSHHPLFMNFFENEYCKHPKEVYRPGNTVVVFFVPFSNQIVESNRGGELPSKEWTDAFYDSMHLCMYLNRIIRDTLDEVGRLHSGTNVPTDWNEELQREEWSHKLAAYAAGLGRFGICGSFHTEIGFAGRLSSIIVDEHYAPFDEEDLLGLDIESFLEHMKTDSKYVGAEDVIVSKKAIEACPCNAISEEGINQVKCQVYCKEINPYIPSPDVCGKCFFYDR